MFKKDKDKKATEETTNNPFIEEQIQEEPVTEELQEETNEDANSKEENNLEDKLKNEIDDLNNKYLRLAADFDNYRKRQAQERESLLKYGALETLTKFIGVLDTLERAQAQIDKLDDIEKVKESYNIITKQFMDSLEKCGLEKIQAEGQKFDPNLHEAVAQTQTNDYEDQTIINQMQTGYKLGDKVLRPAMVNVAVNEEN